MRNTKTIDVAAINAELKQHRESLTHTIYVVAAVAWSYSGNEFRIVAWHATEKAARRHHLVAERWKSDHIARSIKAKVSPYDPDGPLICRDQYKPAYGVEAVPSFMAPKLREKRRKARQHV